MMLLDRFILMLKELDAVEVCDREVVVANDLLLELLVGLALQILLRRESQQECSDEESGVRKGMGQLTAVIIGVGCA